MFAKKLRSLEQGNQNLQKKSATFGVQGADCPLQVWVCSLRATRELKTRSARKRRAGCSQQACRWSPKGPNYQSHILCMTKGSSSKGGWPKGTDPDLQFLSVSATICGFLCPHDASFSGKGLMLPLSSWKPWEAQKISSPSLKVGQKYKIRKFLDFWPRFGLISGTPTQTYFWTYFWPTWLFWRFQSHTWRSHVDKSSELKGSELHKGLRLKGSWMTCCHQVGLKLMATDLTISFSWLCTWFFGCMLED